MELEPGFNYEVLSEENRSLVQQRTRELKERLQRTAQDIWEIGKKLVEVRSELKGHGYFDAWLRAEFGWSRRTAYNFIYVYEAFPYAKFAQMIIEPSALYRLASPSTPSTIRDKFIQQANAGSKVTHKEVLKAVTAEKLKQVPNSIERSLKSAAVPTTEAENSKQKSTAAETKSIIPEIQQPPYKAAPPKANPTIATPRFHQSRWYTLGQNHLLFCGNTNSREFFDRLPEAAFALDLAAGGKWQHEWLMYKARSALILHPRERIDGARIRQLLLMFSEREDAIILPCAPSGEAIVTIDRLKRKLFAGYADRQQCEQAIADSGLKGQKVELP
jgi:DNA modification methylase